MNDLGEEDKAGTPSMCSKMWTYPSLFTPWPPLIPLYKSPFSRKTRRFCCPHSISHGTHLEDNSCTLSKTVCLLNEEPPSTSSASRHFRLNSAEMSKDLRRVEGPHSSGPLWSRGPGRGLVSEVAVCQFTHQYKRG